MTNKNDIRVGVIGVGYLGRFHAEKYSSMLGVQLVGLVDVDSEKLAAVSGELNSHGYSRLEDLLSAGVDAVSVVVPTPLHHSVSKMCLESGVHVLVEKPFTVSLDEADEIIALAKEKGKVLQVGHLERFNPALKSLAEEISTPMFIEAHRLASFGSRGTEVDVILDLMIHDLDIVAWAVDRPIKSVSAVGVPVLSEKIDIANARLEFEGGCVANLTASRVSLQTMRKVRFFQADGYFSLDFGSKKAQVVRRSQDGNGQPSVSGEEIDIAENDALEDELKSFVQAIKSGNSPLVGGDEGRRALEVALRVRDAVQERWEHYDGTIPNGILNKVLQ